MFKDSKIQLQIFIQNWYQRYHAPTVIDFALLAEAQKNDKDLQTLDTSSLR